MQKTKTHKRRADDVKTRSRFVSLRGRAAEVDPMIVAAGAAVVGAVAAVFVPQSLGEARLLAPAGKSLKDAGRMLGWGARQALSAELAGVPVVGQIAAEQIDRVIESVVHPEASADVPVAQPTITA